MGTVNLGQVAALIQSVTFETLPEGAVPTVRNDGTKANAELVFGLPDFMTTAKVKEAVETKVKEAVTAKEISLLTKIDKKFIEQYKNGYIQWPGMPSPLEDTSLHFEGYSWYEINYDGNFFRAKGRNAKAFSAKRLTKEQIKDGAYIFQDDEQEDAIRNLTGSFGYKMDLETSTGCFKDENLTTFFTQNGEYARWRKCSFNLTNIDGVNVAEENRSRNLAFTIWALVKDA